MDPENYLKSQGWKPGEGLRPGSIKRPLLVKHRKDNKGLGHNPMANEGWWERVFDGHLKSLDAFSGSNGVTFAKDEEKLRKSISPLYAMFRPGGVLEGTIEVERDSTVKDSSLTAVRNGKVEKSKDKKKSKKKDKSKSKIRSKSEREDKSGKKKKSKRDRGSSEDRESRKRRKRE